MKKIITLLTVLVCTGFSFAVNAQLVAHNATTLVNGSDTALLISHVTIINTSSSATVVVKVTRTNVSLAPGHDSYFCWGTTCYPPPTNTSPLPVTLAPGDSTTSFIGYADPQGSNGTDMVSYSFFDTSNVSNKVSVEFTYDFATGVNEFSPASGSFLNCSQSNIKDAVNINYNIANFKNAKLVVRNITGAIVKEIELSDKQGTLTISTSDLRSGLYMYCLYNSSEAIATKKMVVFNR